MAFVEDLFEGNIISGNIVTGLAIGVGALVLGPIIAPAISAVVRPAAKAVIKAGLYAYDRGAEVVGQMSERTGDIMAEIRSEMEPRPDTGEEHSRSERRGRSRAAAGTVAEQAG